MTPTHKYRQPINIMELMTNKRIMSFVKRLRQNDDNDCRIWTGSIEPNGYGRMAIRIGKNIVFPKAHRIAYFLAHPDDDPNRYIKHRCNNRACCNPDHLVAT